MAQFKIRNMKTDEVIAKKNRAVGRGLYKGAAYIMGKSNAIAPKAEGTSIQTSGVAIDEAMGRANMYYTQKYDPRNHEHPEFNFQGGRQGKFLEKPVLSHGEEAKNIIAREISDGLG